MLQDQQQDYDRRRLARLSDSDARAPAAMRASARRHFDGVC
jgi:hypothetical protein